MEKLWFIKSLIRMSDSGVINKLMIRQLDSFLYRSIVNGNSRNTREIRLRRFDFLSSMLHSAMKNVRKGYISKYAVNRLTEVLVENSFFKDSTEIVEKHNMFMNKYGFDAPSFIVLSPIRGCNLRCTGCYACSDKNGSPSLPWEVVDKIVGEVHDLLGAHFVVISGGEPFLYKDNGHTLIDIFRKYRDMFFLIYTNGTLISAEVARELASAGNATPAISVEGFEKETDERRGEGVYRRVLNAFGNLRDAGVPFGISVTATSKNTHVLLTEDFYNFYFDDQGASYMWQFQFLPIGSGNRTFDLVVKPEDRMKLYWMWEKQISENKHCIADFWNSGMITSGCIAYGGNHGYFYIDWNGNIMPCVFIPYYIDNIIELYKQGKDLTYALRSEFMKRGREWQESYGLSHPEKPDNWLMPCSYRDHFKNFSENIITHDVKCENQEAADILFDKDYYNKMTEYDEELNKITDPVWKNKYLMENNSGPEAGAGHRGRRIDHKDQKLKVNPGRRRKTFATAPDER